MAESMQTHFDYLVIGTGLRQSLLAAALTKSGHSILHVDENTYYGQRQAVFSLTEFVDWVKTRNEQKPASEHVDLSFPASNSSDSSTSASTFTSSSTPELPAELVRIARQYNISLCPTIVPSIGPFVSSLVRSGVAKYSSFKLIDVVALYEDGKLKPAATTKEEIFKDKTMSLVEKRRLMKFVMAANSDAEDGPFGKQAEESESTKLEDTLGQQYSLTGQLQDLIIYAATLSCSKTCSTIPSIHRLRKYVRSTGRFGKSPFLLGQYGGIGEIVQGFCRVAAVFGGTYMLGRSLQSITYPERDTPAVVKFAEDESYTADCVISIEEDGSNKIRTKVHRGIVILAKPVLLARMPVDPSQENESDEAEVKYDNTLFIIPPGRLSEGQPTNPISVLMAGEGSFSAPAGQSILYMSCLASKSETAKESLQPALRALMHASDGGDISESDVIMAAYYSEDAEEPLVAYKRGEHFLTPQSEDLTTLIGVAEVCDTAVSEATACYLSITGEDELFVQAEQEPEDQDDM